MDLTSDDDLYKAVILEHSSRPPHKRRLENATHYDEGINPSCGDEVELFMRIQDNRIEECTFDGVGCSICLASASIMTDMLQGKSVDEGKAIQEAFKTWITVRDPEPSPIDLEELEALGGVRNYPVRLKCALLAWETFVGALKNSSLN